MKKIIGYRYQCPTCGYTYKLYNGGIRPQADYLCPIHKIVMPAMVIELGEDLWAPVIRGDGREAGWIETGPLDCIGCVYQHEDVLDCMYCSRAYSDEYTPK